MSPCCDKRRTNRGAWSKEEDQKLINYIRAHGEGRWRSLPKAAGLLRCGKSCRLRWINYLRPDVKRGNFEEDEADLIVKLHALLGNRWSLIAGRLPGRTDNEVKNYWNSHLRKKLAGMGIDPNNHRVTPPPPLYPSHSSNGTAATPSSINGVCWRTNSINVDDNRASDCAGGSCSGGGQLPDLNIDLTFCAMASSSSGDLLSAEPILALDQNTDEPTLLLFR